MDGVETTVLLLSFGQFVDGDGKKDGCLASRESGMEACTTALAGNFLEGRLVLITLSDFGSICSIVGLVFAVVVFIYSETRK